MITKENDRTQTAVSSSFERQTQTSQPPAEAAAEQPRAFEQPSLPLRDPLHFTSLVVAGSTMAAMFGLGALVLSILGLSSVAMIYVSPAAAIVLGCGFLMLAGVGSSWARMFGFAERPVARDRTAFFGGAAAVTIAGIAAVVLGILSLMFLAGPRFGAAAVIVLGLGLLGHSAVMWQVSRFTYHGTETRRPHGLLAINALTLAPVRDFILGLGSVILGILAVLNTAPAVLGCVALLAMGTGLTITASTLCGATLYSLEGACSKSKG